MSSFRILPLSRDSALLSEQQLYDDEKYLAMLEEMLGLDGYFFSTTLHVTHSLQRIAGMKMDGEAMWKLVGLGSLQRLRLESYSGNQTNRRTTGSFSTDICSRGLSTPTGRNAICRGSSCPSFADVGLIIARLSTLL